MAIKPYTRKIDELGRIALPQEVRTALGIKNRQSLDIYVKDSFIIILNNADKPSCVLCGDSDAALIEAEHNLLCRNCISTIKAI